MARSPLSDPEQLQSPNSSDGATLALVVQCWDEVKTTRRNPNIGVAVAVAVAVAGLVTLSREIRSE